MVIITNAYNNVASSFFSERFQNNYYKFTIISSSKNVSDFLPKIKTTTSKVYDYSLGNSKEIPTKHLCLPIWFGLEDAISDQVAKELKDSKRKKNAFIKLHFIC